MTKHDIKVPAAAARSTDPCTSQWAAETVRSRRQMAHLLRVMGTAPDTSKTGAGSTDWEIYHGAIVLFGFTDTEQGLRSRRADAVKLGLVEMTDRMGMSPTGRACKRWRLTEKGKAVSEYIAHEIGEVLCDVVF